MTPETSLLTVATYLVGGAQPEPPDARDSECRRCLLRRGGAPPET